MGIKEYLKSTKKSILPAFKQYPFLVNTVCREIENKYNTIETIKISTPPDLSVLYDKICCNYLKYTNIIDINSTDIVKVPWIMFSIKDPICLGSDYHFCNYFFQQIDKQFKLIKIKVLKNLWHLLLLEYPFKMNTFSYLVNKMIESFEKSNSKKLEKYLAVQNKYFLFNHNGPELCAEDSFSLASITQALEKRSIVSESLTVGGFARQVFYCCLERISKLLECKGNKDEVQNKLKILKKEKKLFEAASNQPAKVISPLLSPFTKKDSNLQELEYKEIIKNLLVKEFGDPRLPVNRVKWSGVSSNEQTIIKRWLVIQDLELFFDIIEQTSDPRWKERRLFWYKYLERNLISESWPVLGTQAQSLANRLKPKPHFGQISNIGRQSVLLLQMGHLTIAEWSHNGACRIWLYDDQQAPQLYINKYDRQELLAPSSEWIPHNYNWQVKLKSIISSYLNIDP
jgi:hypothetical protein